MPSIFNEAELKILTFDSRSKNPKIRPMEVNALAQGRNVDLELVMRARRIVDELAAITPQNIATKTEMALLSDTVNQVMLKNFLLFKVLESKGIVTENELLDMAISLEKEATDGPKPKAATRSKAGRPKRKQARPKKK